MWICGERAPVVSRAATSARACFFAFVERRGGNRGSFSGFPSMVSDAGDAMTAPRTKASKGTNGPHWYRFGYRTYAT